MTTDNTSVLVTPLAPPFSGKVAFVDFEPRDDGTAKTLAVSMRDYDKLTALFANQMMGRALVMEAAKDGKRIRISVVPS